MVSFDEPEMALAFQAFERAVNRADGGRFREWVIDQLPVKPPCCADEPCSGAEPRQGRVIDLGTGAGSMLPLLAQRYGHVIAVDPSAAMLRCARDVAVAIEGAGPVRVLDPNIAPRVDADDAACTVELVKASLWRLTPSTCTPTCGERAAPAYLDCDVLSVTTLHHTGPPLDLVLPRVRDLVGPGRTLVVVDMVDPTGDSWGRDEFLFGRAMDTAGAVWDGTGDRSAVVHALRLLLSDPWAELCRTDQPPTRAEVEEQYGKAFPGVKIYTSGDDDVPLHPHMFAAVWTRPADGEA